MIICYFFFIIKEGKKIILIVIISLFFFHVKQDFSKMKEVLGEGYCMKYLNSIVQLTFTDLG